MTTKDGAWPKKPPADWDEFWLEAEQFLGQLPPCLLRQAVLVKDNLATFFSNTGQFRDIMCRVQDPPLLYLHGWLLADWNIPPHTERRRMERHLFLAMLFAFAASYTQETMLDENSNIDNSFTPLIQILTQASMVQFARLFPAGSPFWSYYQAQWQTYAGTVVADTQPGNTVELPNQDRLAAHLAYTHLPVVAVALKTGHKAALPQLNQMMEQYNIAAQIMRGVITLRPDLARRRTTYPALKTMQLAGLDPQAAYQPEQILGAALLSGALETIGQECSSHLDTAQRLATDLKLPTVAACFAAFQGWIHQTMAPFTLKSKAINNPLAALMARAAAPTPPTATTAPLPATAPALLQIIRMAEDYLLADPSFRESWEVQRRGVFNTSRITAKAFPMGLVSEILCRHGHAMTTTIDEIFRTLQANGFRYYDHPHLPPDSDDLALLLRLYPYSGQPETHHAIVQPILQELISCMAATGKIPVWLAQPQTVQSNVRLWGNYCAAVEANMLLGLLALGEIDIFPVGQPDGWSSLTASVRHNLTEWTSRGISASAHYVPLYALWVITDLISKLNASPLAAPLRPELASATRRCRDLLAIEAKRYSLTPQDAAFLTLAHLNSDQPVKARWLDILSQQQRYDGSWTGEPLYGTPTRGEFAAWYSSRTVTTAFCYHTLRTYEAALHIERQDE